MRSSVVDDDWRIKVSLWNDLPALALPWELLVPLERMALLILMRRPDSFVTRRGNRRGTQVVYTNFVADDVLTRAVDRGAFMWRSLVNTLLSCTQDSEGGGYAFLESAELFARAFIMWADALRNGASVLAVPGQVEELAAARQTACCVAHWLRTDERLYEILTEHCEKTARERESWRLSEYGAVAMALRHKLPLPPADTKEPPEISALREDDFARHMASEDGVFAHLDKAFDEAMGT